MATVSKKAVVKIGLKVGIGLLLIYYVIQANMVDFTSLRQAVFQPVNLTVCLTFLFIGVLVTSVRWYLLTRAQGLALSLNSAFQLTMIGFFFNTFMPGAVGGDVIKAWYVAGQEPTRKTKAIFTVLLDRVLGLSVIVAYASVTLLFFTEQLAGRPQLQMLAYSVWAFTSCGIVFVLFFFASVIWQSDRQNTVFELLHRLGPLGKMADAVLLYRHHAPAVISAALLSCVNVFSITMIFYVSGQQLGISLDVWSYFFVVPLGLTASAIPLMPGGIGVGQVAFYTLFAWIGMKNPDQGGTLCTMFQIYIMLFNCAGFIFYIKYKQRPLPSKLPLNSANLSDGNPEACHVRAEP